MKHMKLPDPNDYEHSWPPDLALPESMVAEINKPASEWSGGWVQKYSAMQARAEQAMLEIYSLRNPDAVPYIPDLDEAVG